MVCWVSYRNDIVYIIDTHISTDTIDTDIKYRQKTEYYNKPEILSYAKQLTGAKHTNLIASCWNWRSSPSYLKYIYLYSLGLRKHDITLLSIRVMIVYIFIVNTAAKDYCQNHNFLAFPLPTSSFF